MLINKMFGFGLLGAVAQKLANHFIDADERAFFGNRNQLRNPIADLINRGLNLIIDPPN